MKVPSSLYDPRFEEVPDDKIQQTEAQLHALYKDVKNPWSDKVEERVMEASRLAGTGRQSKIMQEKHEDMRVKWVYDWPKNCIYASELFCEKEIEIIRRKKKSNKLAWNELHDAGFVRDQSDLASAPAQRKNSKDFCNYFITLEESYEARELIDRYKGAWGRVYAVLGVKREGSHQAMNNMYSLINHLKRTLNGYGDPVPWTSKEEKQLIRGFELMVVPTTKVLGSE